MGFRKLLDHQEGRLVLGNPLFHAQAGVTLLEAMVVLAIMAVLLMIGVPGLQSWFVSGQVTAKTEAILNGLQLARAEALRRNSRVYFTLGSDFAWTVGCVNAVGDLDGDGVADCPSIIQAKAAAEAGEGATLSGSGTATFSGIGMLATNADASAPISQVDISYSAGGASKALRVLLTSGGQSRICDPAVTTTGDPAKC